MKEPARRLTFIFVLLVPGGLGRATESSLPPDYSIPVIDLSKDTNRQVIVDKEPGPSACSCLTVLPDTDIVCLYETGQKHPYETIAFARFAIDRLTAGKENSRDLKKKSGIMPNNK